jgi:hypothetical protein
VVAGEGADAGVGDDAGVGEDAGEGADAGAGDGVDAGAGDGVDAGAGDGVDAGVDAGAGDDTHVNDDTTAGGDADGDVRANEVTDTDTETNTSNDVTNGTQPIDDARTEPTPTARESGCGAGNSPLGLVFVFALASGLVPSPLRRRKLRVRPAVRG